MRDYLSFYNRLNNRQREAVDCINGPLVVLAGPGTGKTQLLSVRSASILLKAPVKPENVLILTYTNPAAKAMKDRLVQIIGHKGYDIEVGTFHSFANSILQESIESANYLADRVLMTDIEQIKALKFVLDHTDGLEDIRPFNAPYTYLKDIQKGISDLKKDDISPEELKRYLNREDSYYKDMDEKYVNRLKAFSAAYAKYEEIKLEGSRGVFDNRGRYDFDDMIMLAIKAIVNEGDLRGELLSRYKYVMVDEFQDTNLAQLDLLFSILSEKDPNICFVGDDDQSIYRFQGATIDNFRRVSEKFVNISRIKLTHNYRSSPALIEKSKSIIGIIPSSKRVEDKALSAVKNYSKHEISFKEFTTEEEELLYIVKRVKMLKKEIEHDESLTQDEREHPYNHIAILTRKRAQIMKITDIFLRSGIPYATDGKEDIGREIRVNQMLDVLDLADINARDVERKDLSLYRVLSADYFRIEQKDILKFIKIANENIKRNAGNSTILIEFLNNFNDDKAYEWLNSLENFKKAHFAIKRLVEKSAFTPIHSLVMDYVNDSGIYAFILQEYCGNNVLRIRELRSLSSFISMIKSSDLANPGMRLSDFMQEMRLRKEHGISIQGRLVTLSQEGVRIYTVHGAKGLEFHSVILPFCIQNKSWPLKARSDRIKIPHDIGQSSFAEKEREVSPELGLYDETRLFYVAITRAKANLILTASPGEDQVVTSYMDIIAPELARHKGDDNSEEGIIMSSLCQTTARDPFIGTEKILRDMLSNMTLNPTRLNNYMRCRRKFLYNDVLKLPGPKKKSLVFGNCVHKALEEVFREYKKVSIFPDWGLFEDNFKKELRYQSGDNSITREVLKKIPNLKKWFDHAGKNPAIPIDLEKKLMVTIGENIIFTGKYDKVEWVDESKNTVCIVDYKTGKPDEHFKRIEKCRDLASDECDDYLRQLVAYKILFDRCLKESKGRTAQCGRLVFIEPLGANMIKLGLKKGDFVSKTVMITDDMIIQLENIIKCVWANINDLRFEKLAEREPDICDKCDFRGICWKE